MKLKKSVLYLIYFIILNLIPYVPIKDCWYGFNIDTHKPGGWCNWKTCQPSLIPCMHTEGDVNILGIANHFLAIIIQLIFVFVVPYLLAMLTFFISKRFKNNNLK